MPAIWWGSAHPGDSVFLAMAKTARSRRRTRRRAFMRTAICAILDTGVVARILATGATAGEVPRPLPGTAPTTGRGGGRAVYDILAQEEPDPDELG